MSLLMYILLLFFLAFALRHISRSVVDLEGQLQERINVCERVYAHLDISSEPTTRNPSRLSFFRETFDGQYFTVRNTS